MYFRINKLLKLKLSFKVLIYDLKKKRCIKNQGNVLWLTSYSRSVADKKGERYEKLSGPQKCHMT